MAIVTTFRAVSGSQFVYFTSQETEPANITNKVVVSRKNTGAATSVDAQAVISQSVASGSALIWEWNGVDTSQFESSNAVGHISMSVVTAPSSCSYENLLRIDPTDTTEVESIRFIKSSSLALPDAFVVEMVVWDKDLSGRHSGWAWGDPDHPDGLHAYCFALAGAGQPDKDRYDAGTEIDTAGTFSPSNRCLIISEGGTLVTFAEKRHPSGSAPSFWVYGQGQEGIRGSSFNDYYKGQTPLYFSKSLGAPTASWASANMNRIGINFRGNTLGDHFIEYAAIRIYKHPKND